VVVARDEALRRLAALGGTTDGEELSVAARRSLSAAASLQPAQAGDEGAWAAQLAVVGLPDPRRDWMPDGIIVELDLVPPGDALPIRERGVGRVRGGPQGFAPPPAVQAAAVAAIDDAASGIAQHLAASAKSDAALLRDLDVADPATRDHAVRVLAERKNPAAVPALITRLQDPDPYVVERAIGALAEIGDRRAVVPLIDVAHRRGVRGGMDQLVRIVADLGGPVAMAWLDAVAVGHPDEDIRAAAAESLEVLRRREGLRTGAAAAR
jgi:hypothetical protein